MYVIAFDVCVKGWAQLLHVISFAYMHDRVRVGSEVCVCLTNLQFVKFQRFKSTSFGFVFESSIVSCLILWLARFSVCCRLHRTGDCLFWCGVIHGCRSWSWVQMVLEAFAGERSFDSLVQEVPSIWVRLNGMWNDETNHASYSHFRVPDSYSFLNSWCVPLSGCGFQLVSLTDKLWKDIQYSTQPGRSL